MEAQASIHPPLPSFTASSREKIGAFAAYFLAYLYADAFLFYQPDQLLRQILMTLFVAVFVCGALLLVQGCPIPAESWFWLGCLAAVALGRIWGQYRVWGETGDLLLHGFAIYWVLAVTDRLMDGGSGRYLALDLWNGVFAFPIRHFTLRIRCVAAALRGKEKHKGALPVAASVVSGGALLVVAALLLGRADGTFQAVTDRFFGLFRNFRPDAFGGRLLLSLPVGAWLFGLMAGACRTDAEKLRARGGRIQAGLEKLRAVPAGVWNVVLAVFCLLYLTFFVVQGSYLLGAFFHRLPEGFTVAAYARRGFFELCGVAVLNNLLLWMVRRSATDTGAGKVFCTLLTCCTILLAVTALSKLALYISCFGFTPRRLQSTWLVCVLLAGGVTTLIHLWTGKRTSKSWIWFSGATLALLALY